MRPIFRLILLTTLGAVARPVFAQSSENVPNLIILSEVNGFVPFDQSYRINYQNNLAGLPVEIKAGIAFPITPSLSSLFALQYIRRAAIYIPKLDIRTVEIHSGVRDYLEQKKQNDLRLFGSGGLLLAESTVTGSINTSSDGRNFHPLTVSKSYFNLGIGLGLGVEYPLGDISALYAGLNISVYFLDPATTGGLGNIGGLSVGLGYRINI